MMPLNRMPPICIHRNAHRFTGFPGCAKPECDGGPPDGVAPGRGREWPAPAWSCDASFVIAGDSGASVWGLSAR